MDELLTIITIMSIKEANSIKKKRLTFVKRNLQNIIKTD